MMRFSIAFILIVANFVIAAAPTTVPSIVRKPQWPLKDRRTLYSDAHIAQLRVNVAKYPSAKAVADGWIKLADEWVTWNDDKLAGLIASAVVPRDWGINADPNCPECGKPIQDPNGKPGWIIDPKRPFKTECPLCHTVFPSNDFAAYYRSDFKTKIGWGTKYVDDGWGWTDPKTGQKYWFVAFANHWTMHAKLMGALNGLSRAYLVTGDKRYAHKALVLLHRYAEVYPEMDYGAQSRYGALMRAQGSDYPGKVAYNTWETDLVTAMCQAYDACWDTIDTDDALHSFTGKSGKAIRAFIEANLLEDAIDAYFQGKILGNFGMHQSTLAHLGIVREYGEQDKWFDLLMNESSASYQRLGLKFALYNVVFRDGFSLETSSHYNSLWVKKITEYASILEKTGRKPFEIPKLRRLYDAVLAMIVTRGNNPAVGDGGNVYGDIFPHEPTSFATAYREYHDPRYLQYIYAMYGPPKDGGFNSFESLFLPPIETPTNMPTTHPAQASRLLDGYGMGILNNQPDSTGIALYYGMIAGHGHYDRLEFELYANGQAMMPDLGYPDGVQDFIPGIHSWSKNTVAHNTVVVDASRQPKNVPGTVNLFVNGSSVRAIDVSANETYPQCEQYRRAIVQVDCGNEQSYFVDFFTVVGGKQHDYSLHGPPGAFETIGGEWLQQPRGTLAGEKVEVGEFYDDPKLAAPNYTGGYSSYMGSGFQHLYNVRRHLSGETILQWTHEKDPAAKLRIRVLDQPDQQIILANARVSPIKFPQVLTYLIARRTGKDKLSSQFVSVIEPFKDQPLIAKITRIDAMTIEVEQTDGSRDRITYDAEDARVTVTRAHGRFEAGGRKSMRTGEVVGIDAAKSLIRVRPDSNPVRPEDFVGRVVHLRNELRRTAHPIIAASREGDDIILATGDDLLVGRAHINEVADDEVLTGTSLMLAPIYRGVTLASPRYEPLARVKEVSKGKIKLATPIDPAKRPASGDDLWLINVGPGDRFELPAVLESAAGSSPSGRG